MDPVESSISLPAHDNAAEPASDLELIQAEVATETVKHDNLPEGAVLVPLGDTVVAVLHPDDWPSSANEDVNAERFLTWALKVLATDEDKALWLAMDPINRQVGQFLLDWQKAIGAPLGGVAAISRMSSWDTQRRLKAI